MTPRTRAFFQFATLVMVAVLLIVLFKPVAAFAEMAARELRYLWWLILLVGLAVWLIWGVSRRPKK
jgi:type VI protein secretion system component VasK